MPSGEKSLPFCCSGSASLLCSSLECASGEKKGKLGFSEENENHFFKTKMF